MRRTFWLLPVLLLAISHAALAQLNPGNTVTTTPAPGTSSAPLSPTLTTPPSTLTRPANTTAYVGSSTTPQLIGSNVTAGSVVVPSFSIANSGGHAAIPRLTIATNVTTGWGGVSLTITLWTAAPTYSTGDGATYTVATGSALRRSIYTCTLIQNADGASCNAAAATGNAPVIAPASGALVYWDVQIAAAATPISGQTFTLTPEVWN